MQQIALKNINELRALPPNEKFQIIQMLWDDLIADNDNVLSPDWHEEELLQTKTAYRDWRTEALDWSTAKNLLRKQLDVNYDLN